MFVTDGKAHGDFNGSREKKMAAAPRNNKPRRRCTSVVFVLSATTVVNVAVGKPPLTFIVATRFHNARGSTLSGDFLNTCRDVYVTWFHECRGLA